MKLHRSVGIVLRILAVVSIVGCSSSYSRYTPEQKIVYRYKLGDRIINSDLDPLYYDLEDWRKISLSLHFSEGLGRAGNLKSVHVQLFEKDPSGTYTREIPVTQSYAEVEYWNGTTSIKKRVDDLSVPLSSAFEPGLADYRFRDMHAFHVVLRNDYAVRGHPDSLQQRITIKWADRPDEVFVNHLKKTEFSKSCISGRPFG